MWRPVAHSGRARIRTLAVIFGGRDRGLYPLARVRAQRHRPPFLLRDDGSSRPPGSAPPFPPTGRHRPTGAAFFFAMPAWATMVPASSAALASATPSLRDRPRCCAQRQGPNSDSRCDFRRPRSRSLSLGAGARATQLTRATASWSPLFKRRQRRARFQWTSTRRQLDCARTL